MYALYRFSPTPVSTQLTRAQHAHCQPSAIPSRFPLSSLVAYSRKGKYVIYTILTHLSNPSLVVSLYFLALRSAPPHTNFYSLPTSASGQQQFVASSWRLFTVRCLFTVNQCLLSVIDYQLFTIYYYLLLLFTIIYYLLLSCCYCYCLFTPNVTQLRQHRGSSPLNQSRLPRQAQKEMLHDLFPSVKSLNLFSHYSSPLTHTPQTAYNLHRMIIRRSSNGCAQGAQANFRCPQCKAVLS
jgi:hypothetical protein